MLFGFVMAAMAGFLLTAVAQFTGRPPIRGALLAGLFLAWLAGRLAMALSPVLGVAVVAVLDLSFPLLLAALVAREIVASANWPNLVLVAVLGLLTIADGVFHGARAGLLDVAPATVVRDTLHLAALMITLIGGRIIPAFTRNWLAARDRAPLPVSRRPLEALVGAPSALSGTLAVLAGLVHAARLAGWRGLATWREPLLLVLHLGYAWLAFAYLVLGAALLDAGPSLSAGVHALTVGAMGTMVLAVMSRVALGHTGRALHASAPTVVGYALLTAAALLRMAATLGAGLSMIYLSGALWIAAFALFVGVYWSALTGPRVD
jgi:uncharacterized protein involved in response to NO